MSRRPPVAFRFAPLPQPRQSDEVARRVAAAIREGAFRCGDRLPSERALAEQLAVSRPTVREAVRQLAEAGILTVRPGAAGGMFVASELVPLQMIHATADLRPGEMIEILEARRLLVPRIVEVASHYAGDDDYERMRDAIAFGREVLPVTATPIPETVKQHLNISCVRFDIAVAAATRNHLLVQMMKMLLDWLEPLRMLSLRDAASAEMAMAIQDETLAAMEGGDVASMHAVMDRRMNIIERAWEATSGRPIRRRRPDFLEPMV